MTNALAFYNTLLIRTLKSFIVYTIKHFRFANWCCSLRVHHYRSFPPKFDICQEVVQVTIDVARLEVTKSDKHSRFLHYFII
jgi:hypothetical protein